MEKPRTDRSFMTSGIAATLYYYRARYYDPQGGRFISEDPVGDQAGPNRYLYALASPTNLIDPTGLNSSATQSGNTITISASVTLYGPNASSALAQAWETEINSFWNNNGNFFNHANCVVKFKVRVIADPSANHWFTAKVAGPTPNYVYVVSDPGFRSNFGWMFGSWSSGADSGVIGHEAGHIFGLPDDYHDVDGTSIPNFGHVDHIMAQSSGHIAQHEIDDIVSGRSSCGCAK